jgi:hypothetical protein
MSTILLIKSIISSLMSYKVIILGFLFSLSELLALIPSVKSNSVFQMIYNYLKKVLGR